MKIKQEAVTLQFAPKENKPHTILNQLACKKRKKKKLNPVFVVQMFSEIFLG